jgi:hypothetical protein
MPGYIRITIGPVPLMERVADELGHALRGDEGQRLEGAARA